MALQMTNERMEAYVEVLEILRHMDEKYVNMIPKELMQFFKKNSSNYYEFKLDVNKSLIEQNLKPKTLCVLGMLNLNYWCADEEEKERLTKLYSENENKYEEMFKVEFNPDGIFNKLRKESTAIQQNDTQAISIVEPKELWFKKIFRRLKKIFRQIK